MESQAPSVPSAPSTPPEGGAYPSSMSARSFGHYSQFLRAALADEESLQLGENLQTMAGQIEQVAALLRAPPVDDRTAIARALVELLDLLRDHRHQVQEMGKDWHASYEFKNHFLALTQFRSLATRWASEAGPPRNLPPSCEEFELAGWRLLGAGALLLDAFEQAGHAALPEGDANASGSASWWGRLLTVLHLKP